MRLTNTIGTVAWIALLLIAGCSQSSHPSANVQSVRSADSVSAEEAEVSILLDQYHRLPLEQRNGLAGDQIIMRVETLLKTGASRNESKAEGVVRKHNEKMLQRALQDPDLLEVTGTELAPTPRER